MKKIILFVDNDNSHFLIIKNNLDYLLPTLNYTINIENAFYKKYLIKIRNCTILKEYDNYIIVKCFTVEKLKENIFIINDLLTLLTDKEQKSIVLEYNVIIFKEILNDSFWLGILLSVEDQIKNVELKYILSEFLLMFSTIFCNDVLNYKFGEIKNVELLTDQQLKKLRNLYLKQCPIYNSVNIKNIIKNMGIDFNNYVFDIFLFIYNGTLLDVNSRFWNESNSKIKESYDSIIRSPRKWIINFMPKEFSDMSENERTYFINEFKNRISKVNISRKSYSTYKLFNKKLNSNEKIYILQRIGLLKTTMFISEIIGNNNNITIVNGKNKTVMFDSNKFFYKIKATIIEMIWNDKSENKIPLIDEILIYIKPLIPEKFYVINRKCRDNIHYGFYNNITPKEYKILNKYQDLYITTLINKMESLIQYKFNFKYKIYLGLSSLLYWSKNSNKNKKVKMQY